MLPENRNVQCRKLAGLGWPTALFVMVMAGCDLTSNQGSSRGGWPFWNSSPSPSNAATKPSEGPQGTSLAEVKKAGSSASPAVSAQSQATTRAAAEARKAEIAAEEARKASELAVEASRKASEAAQEAGNLNGESDKGATSSAHSDAATPDGGATPAFVLSSNRDGRVGAASKTAETLTRLELALTQLEQRKLNDDLAKRRDLASKLLQSARQALSQKDYSEADSLVEKASVIMAPLGNVLGPQSLSGPEGSAK